MRVVPTTDRAANEEASPDFIPIPLAGPAKGAAKGKARKALAVTLVTLAAIVAIAVGLYFYWIEYLGAADKWLTIRKLEGQELVAPEGKLFLVTGDVYNGSTKPRKYLRLKVKLFDRAGNVITEKESMAGLAMTKEEVGKMARADIDKRLRDFKTSALGVDSHREIPFSVIFFEESFANAKEFTVEIIDAPLPG